MAAQPGIAGASACAPAQRHAAAAGGLDAELLPNPEHCGWFEPNPFKKEKCRDCGRPWTEHQGVISETLLEILRESARQKKAAASRRRQEVAPATSAATAEQRRTPGRQGALAGEATAPARAAPGGQGGRAEEAPAPTKEASSGLETTAVETVAVSAAGQGCAADVDDWWSQEGGQKAAAPPEPLASEDSEGEDAGFRMLRPQDLAAAIFRGQKLAPSGNRSTKPLKVVNLIDLREYDVRSSSLEKPASGGGGGNAMTAGSQNKTEPVAKAAVACPSSPMPSVSSSALAGTFSQRLSSPSPSATATASASTAGAATELRTGTTADATTSAAEKAASSKTQNVAATGTATSAEATDDDDDVLAARHAAPAAAPPGPDAELLTELQHLRLMLADATEERSIQLAIVRDEVAEKSAQLSAARDEATEAQRFTGELLRQQAELEGQLGEARQQFCALEAQAAGERQEAQARLERCESQAEFQRCEALRFRAEAERLQAALQAQQALAGRRAALGHAPAPAAAGQGSAATWQPAPQASPFVEALVAEIRGLCLQTWDALGGGGVEPPSAPAKAPAAAGRLEAELRSLCDAAAAANAAAWRVSAEHGLAVKALGPQGLETPSVPVPVPSLPVRIGPGECLPLPRHMPTTADKAHTAAQAMGRDTAQALRKIRTLSGIGQQRPNPLQVVRRGATHGECLHRLDRTRRPAVAA